MKNNKKIIKDLRGFACPIPLIETKKIIEKNNLGDEIIIKLDTKSSRENISAMLEDKELEFKISKLEGHYEISFTI